MGNQEIPMAHRHQRGVKWLPGLSHNQAFAGAQLIAKSLSILSQEGAVFVGERFVEEFQTPKFLFGACLWIYQVKVVLQFESG